jgi:hypothetical protein
MHSGKELRAIKLKKLMESEGFEQLEDMRVAASEVVPQSRLEAVLKLRPGQPFEHRIVPARLSLRAPLTGASAEWLD